ncbi:MAG: YggS family pyridoxal phosphate-dependent enzyme [Clostridia bacterium]|nr:YggS family pyridoxal phosphate-dependent enzyme [Clostridia bacterium]
MESSCLNDNFSFIEDNLKRINENIAVAAHRSGRSADDITFMAVTKTVEPVMINHAIECGVKLIGENKVQEFLGKKQYLRLDDCEAHLIGHLQTNKVKQIVGQVSMIQSVDSLKLASEISKQSEKLGIVTDCLIEMNIGDQPTKTGAAQDSVEQLIYEAAKLPGIKIKGLMSIPPVCDDEKVLRCYFSKIHDIFIDIKSKKIDNTDMDILSMGMSSDYEEAILEGSTLVRIGSSVFGRRVY